MSTPDLQLPLALRLEDLLFVEVSCSFKPSADSKDVETLSLSAPKGVALVKSKDGKETDKLEGKIAPEAFIPLLMLFEAKGFMELPDEESDEGQNDDDGQLLFLCVSANQHNVLMVKIPTPPNARGRHCAPLSWLLVAPA